MTNEEAIFCLKGIKNIGHDIFTEQKDFQECLDMATKALEQEPCEDCWSKKEVVDIINRQRFGIQKISMGIIKEKLEALPTVTPTRKRGKWLKSNICGAKVCSICLAHMGLSNFKYCPNCGAEMENVENDK